MLRETSIEAFREISADGSLDLMKEMTFKLFKEYGPATSNQIMAIFKKQNPHASQQAVESISRRASDLTKEGRMLALEKVVCPITNHLSYLRIATDAEPRKLTALEKLDQQIEGLKARIEKLKVARTDVGNETPYEHAAVSRAKQVTYDLLLVNSPCTANELMKAFKEENPNAIHQNVETIGKTLSFLRDDGSVKELDYVKCSVTGKTVIQWGVTGQTPKKLSKLQQIDLRISKAEKQLVVVQDRRNKHLFSL